MSERKAAVSTDVQDIILKLDVDAVGIASIDSVKGTRLEEAALHLLPETASIVVMAMEIYTEILDQSRPGRETGKVSLNDLLDRDADFINGRLTKAAYDVGRAAHKHGLKALPLPAAGCPADARFLAAVFSYKHAAQVAGLGYIGQSSLLVTPEFGPRVRLSCCLTEARLEPTAVTPFNMCGGCEICIDNCPAKALGRPDGGEPYVINKFACSSFRVAGGGCSECMRLCPAGR